MVVPLELMNITVRLNITVFSFSTAYGPLYRDNGHHITIKQIYLFLCNFLWSSLQRYCTSYCDLKSQSFLLQLLVILFPEIIDIIVRLTIAIFSFTTSGSPLFKDHRYHITIKDSYLFFYSFMWSSFQR